MAAALLSGCSSLHWLGLGKAHTPAAAPAQDESLHPLQEAQQQLDQLRAAPELATRVASEIDDAQKALRLAQTPASDPALTEHQRYMAQKSVQLAWVRARERAMEARLQDWAKASGDKRLASVNPQNRTMAPLTPPPRLSAPSPDSLKPARSRTSAPPQTSFNSLVLPDSVFTSHGTQLSTAGTQALSGIISALNAPPNSPLAKATSGSERRVTIRAYSSASRDDSAALDLARTKAEAVRKVLLDQGISAAQIDAQAYAELPVTGTTAPAAVPRVEIKVTAPSE